MTQIPSTAAVSTNNAVHTDIRNEVCKECFGAIYTGLSAEFQTTVDQADGDALFEYTNLLKWWVATGDTTFTTPTGDFVPPVFNELFKLMWVHRLLRARRSDEAADTYFKSFVAPLFGRTAEAFDGEFGAQSSLADIGDTMSVITLRRMVITTALRQRTPVIPPMARVHQIIRSEFVKLWKSRRWVWRVKPRRITINADGSTTIAGTDLFGGIASKFFTLRGTNGVLGKVAWLDSERFSEASAVYDRGGASADTGVPRWFFDEYDGTTTPLIRWLPAPDQAYTAFANIISDPPAFSDADAGTAAFNQMPLVFRHHLRGRILVAVLSEWGREDVDIRRLRAESEAEYSGLGPTWDDPGSHRSTARGHHHRAFTSGLTSFAGPNVIGQPDY
jgi:hypothetical protein